MLMLMAASMTCSGVGKVWGKCGVCQVRVVHADADGRPYHLQGCGGNVG